MEDLKAEAERLVGLAKFKKLTLLTVESRTAGALACALAEAEAEAEAEGAGEVFHGGFVVYSKEKILYRRRTGRGDLQAYCGERPGS
jgi:nicotinamide mononucleotide (NMN) deamidase PncC